MRSMDAEVKGARVKMDVQARNDVSYTRGTKGEPTVQAGVVEAAWRRYEREPKTEHTKGRVTMCAAVAVLSETVPSDPGEAHREGDEDRIGAWSGQGPNGSGQRRGEGGSVHGRVNSTRG